MAVPSTGPLSLLAISNEVTENDYADGGSATNISLSNLSDGTVATINVINAEANRPDESTPHAMSEWYSYDHDKVGVGSPSNLRYVAPSTTTIKFYYTEASNSTKTFVTIIDVNGSQHAGSSGTTLNVNGFSGTAPNKFQTVDGSGDSDFTVGGGSDTFITPPITTTTLSVSANQNILIEMFGKDNSNNSGVSSNTLRGYTAPSIPTSLSSSVLQDNNGVNGIAGEEELTGRFHWAAPGGGASSYNIKYGTSTDINNAATTLTGVTGTSQTFDDLSNFDTKYWWIQAVGTGGDTGSYSDTQNFNGGQISHLPAITTFPSNPTITELIPVPPLSSTGTSTSVLEAEYNFNTINTTGQYDPVITVTGNSGNGVFRWNASLTSNPSPDNVQGTTNSVTLAGAFGDTIFMIFQFEADSSMSAGSFNRNVILQLGSAFRTMTVNCVASAPPPPPPPPPGPGGPPKGRSDSRLKTNIDRIGYSDMNIPIYLFNYKEDLNTTYKGVMAQDLLELGFNDSVILESDGYYSVDYDSIDVDMEII
tara:strand:+ start:2064 stop:3668 length:1605 start_codon:yes stop_codon:yes gene_type:complete